MLLVTEIENKEYLRKLILAMYPELTESKRKKKSAEKSKAKKMAEEREAEEAKK